MRHPQKLENRQFIIRWEQIAIITQISKNVSDFFLRMPKPHLIPYINSQNHSIILLKKIFQKLSEYFQEQRLIKVNIAIVYQSLTDINIFHTPNP